MKRSFYVRVTESRGCTVTVSDEPWQGELAVTGEDAVTPERIVAVARRKLKLPLIIAETERLLLRELCMEDLAALCALPLTEAERELLGPQAAGLFEESCLRSYIEYQYSFFGYGIWAVLRRDTGALAGLCGFSPGEPPELGYCIGRDYRRLGYATEACRAAFRYAEQELGFTEVGVRIRRDNTASLAFYEKLRPALRDDSPSLQSRFFIL